MYVHYTLTHVYNLHGGKYQYQRRLPCYEATLGKVWTIPLEHKGIADFSSSCSTHTLGSTVRILVLTNVSPFCNHVPHVLWEFSNYLCQDVN